MAYDFKKEQRTLYRPGEQLVVVDVPAMTFLTVRGHGDPNQPGSEYQQSIQLLYGLAYTIKMSKKGPVQPAGYFDFVVPPLEGFWWQEGINGMDYEQKEKLAFISCLRVPAYVTPAVFDWAAKEATAKKGLDFSRGNLQVLTEGKRVQVLHRGRLMMSPRRSASSSSLSSKITCSRTTLISGTTMKSTFPTHGARRRKSSKR